MVDLRDLTAMSEQPALPGMETKPPLKGFDPGVCRYCKAPVLWGKYPTGRTGIFNPELVKITIAEWPKDGLDSKGKQMDPNWRVLRVVEGYISHWATCPKKEEVRDEYRGRK